MIAQDTESRRNISLLPEEVDTYTFVSDRAREVQLTYFLHALILGRTGKACRYALTVIVCEHFVMEIYKCSIDTALRRQPRDEMNIRCISCGRCRDQLLYVIRHCLPPVSP